MNDWPERDWDETDLSTEIQEAREIAYERECERLDREQGIIP